MLFNSIHFLLFFPVFLFLFFSIPPKYRKLLLLVASYYFYLSWKLEYGILLLGSTLVDFFVAQKIERSTLESKRKKLLVISITTNLSFLFLFKYLNFFSTNLVGVINWFGLPYHDPIHRILLPVGISFYTFQSMSYTIDIYRKQIKAESSFISFALFVSFFPQLVAGPIERFTNLHHQFNRVVRLDPQRFAYGLKLMFWGFFQKLVIADSMSPFVDAVYSYPSAYNGITTSIACVFFSFQIYCDFAGYTDIARGIAKIIGIDLSINFQRPYFSFSFIDFWRRWHITLFAWFKNYVYISLGGNRNGKLIQFRNVFIVFLASGIWHGADWTFLAWGATTGCIYLLEMFFNSKFGISHLEKKRFYTLERFGKTLLVFFLVNLTWIFFRANSLTDAQIVYTQIFTNFTGPIAFGLPGIFVNIILIAILLLAHWFDRDGKLIDHVESLITPWRWIIYLTVVLLMLGLGNFGAKQFIYFQF